MHKSKFDPEDLQNNRGVPENKACMSRGYRPQDRSAQCRASSRPIFSTQEVPLAEVDFPAVVVANFVVCAVPGTRRRAENFVVPGASSIRRHTGAHVLNLGAQRSPVAEKHETA